MLSLDEDQKETDDSCCIISNEADNEGQICRFYTTKPKLSENFDYFKALFAKDHFEQNSNNEYYINTDAITMMKLFSTVLGNNHYYALRLLVQSENIVSSWLIYQQLEYLGWIKLGKIHPIHDMIIREYLHENDPRLIISLFQLWKRNLLYNFKFNSILSFVQVGLSLKHLPVDEDINQKRTFAEIMLQKCDTFCAELSHLPIIDAWSSVTPSWINKQCEIDIRWKFIKQSFKWAHYFEFINTLDDDWENPKACIYMAGQCCFDMAKLEAMNVLPKTYDFWIVGTDEYQKQLLCINFLEAIKSDFPDSKIIIKFDGFAQILVSENYVIHVIYSCKSNINEVIRMVDQDYSFMWFDGKTLSATYNAWKDTFDEHKTKGVWDNIKHPVKCETKEIEPVSNSLKCDVLLTWTEFQTRWNFSNFSDGKLLFYKLAAINIKDWSTLIFLNWRLAKAMSCESLACYDNLMWWDWIVQVLCTDHDPVLFTLKGTVVSEYKDRYVDFIQIAVNEEYDQHLRNFLTHLGNINLKPFNDNLLQIMLPYRYCHTAASRLLKLPKQLTFTVLIGITRAINYDYSIILERVYLDW